MVALVAMRREHTTGRSSNYEPANPLAGFDHLQPNPFGHPVINESRTRDVQNPEDGELQEFVDIAQVQQLLQQQTQHQQQHHHHQQPPTTSCLWGAVYPPPPPTISYPHHHHHHHHHHPSESHQSGKYHASITCNIDCSLETLLLRYANLKLFLSTSLPHVFEITSLFEIPIKSKLEHVMLLVQIPVNNPTENFIEYFHQYP
ncbi:hypothetical protein KQX54_005980 [Cotesia glomerata]|uniref:Uncharacterized protein n=1 Tax=Cotesia glomerata TaxID=32391 RepID=A0AAV7IT16_COTGL|nr:hypothetical protein KQX54_005980 [Cotesia glomerata]